jgi:hypothetical protein
MKVSELIDILSKLDKNKDIHFINSDYESGYDLIKIDKVIPFSEFEDYNTETISQPYLISGDIIYWPCDDIKE